MRDCITFRATQKGKRKFYDSNPSSQRMVKVYEPLNYALGKDWVVSRTPLEGIITKVPEGFARKLFFKASEMNEKNGEEGDEEKNGEKVEYITFSKKEWVPWENIDFPAGLDTVVKFGDSYYFKPILFTKVKPKINFEPMDELIEEKIKYDGSHKAFVLFTDFINQDVKAKLQPWYIFGGPKDTEYWSNTEHVHKVLELLNLHFINIPNLSSRKRWIWMVHNDVYDDVPDIGRNDFVQQFFIDHNLADEKYINFMIKLQKETPFPVPTGIPEHPLFSFFPGRAATNEEVKELLGKFSLL